MVSTSKTLCSLVVLVGLVACRQAAGQTQPSNELKFKGTEATEMDSAEGQQQQQQLPGEQESEPSKNDNYNNNEREQYTPRPPQSPLQQLLMPFDFGSIFGQPNNQHGRPSFGMMGPMQLMEPMGGRRGSLIDSLFGQLDSHARNFERQFDQLERQAGEAEEVSYFSRNGVSYVKTCKTRRVQPNGNQLEHQQQQQEQSTPKDKQFSNEIPSLPTASPK